MKEPEFSSDQIEFVLNQTIDRRDSITKEIKENQDIVTELRREHIRTQGILRQLKKIKEIP